MNKIVKLILKVMSSPKIDMKQDYPVIRKVQQFFSRKPIRKKNQILDQKIYSVDGHEIPVRIFYPEVKNHEDVLLFFHGGGWVIGDVDTYTQTCLNMADLTERVVFSVDYRLAPEFPYPAGLDDCYQVTLWVLTHLKVLGLEDISQVTLIGDSAGGNLAAAVALKLRDEQNLVLHNQILLYPVTYWDHSENSPFETIRTKGFDYGLTSKKVQDYMDLYQPDENKRKTPYISPLMCTDLTNQPRTLVITAENDPLRDEGEAYGAALEKAGAYVKIIQVKGTVHGFIGFPKFSKVITEAYQEISRFLNQPVE